MERPVKTGIAVFLCLVFSVVSGWADVITLRADEWCPYNCEPNSADPGFIVEIAQLVFKKAGHTIEYDTMPWARAIQDTRKGKFNGIIGAGKEDAPDFVFPENEQAQMKAAFFVKQGDSWQYDGIDSLKGKILGVIKDYSYVEELDEYIKANAKNSKLIQSASGDTALESNVKKLLADRINALVEDSNVMGLYCKKNLKNDMIKEAGKLAPDELYIAFSPANPKSAEYAKIISDGIAVMRQSGELAAILDKYGIKDWK